ncbi:MAG: sulfatase [Pirellulaceae bacterium]|nr:sulfatase [Pirellulaceae bacterium]
MPYHRLSLVVFFFLSSVAATVTQATAEQRLNVLMICVDDLKPALGCYGDATAKSPNVDRLAKRGLLFQAAYCNQAVCSPSRNALMTSLRPQTLGIYELATNFRASRPEAVTVAQHFRSHGYQTQSLGKIFHTGHGNIDDEASWSVPSWRPKAPTYRLPASTALPAKPKGNGPKGTATESADVGDSEYGEGQLADELILRLDAAAKSSSPFFIAGGFIRPHLPFVAPKKYWDLYDADKLPMPTITTPPEGAPSYAPQFGGELRSYSDMPDQGLLSDPETRKLIHGYYAATSYMDAQLGRVLDRMDALKLWDTTIVLLWGDHGWHLGDHGMWCKHTNYEQATRIPFMIATPKMAAGVTTKAMMETVDIYPTLCELTGLPVPAGLDGKSFVSVIKSPSSSARAAVTHVYPRNALLGRSIRDERYRMVEWKKPGDEPSTAEIELYDYELDGLETKNMAAEKPEVVAKLRKILAQQPEAKPQINAKAKAKTKAKSASKK